MKSILNEQKSYTDKQLKILIENELLYLKYNPAYKGFNYLIEVLFLLSKIEESKVKNLSKNVYPIVARRFNTSPQNVKYNIRNATEAMYYDCPESRLSEYLGFDISTKLKVKPVIYVISRNIRQKINNYI